MQVGAQIKKSMHANLKLKQGEKAVIIMKKVEKQRK